MRISDSGAKELGTLHTYVLNCSWQGDQFVEMKERVHIPIVTKRSVHYTTCSISERPHDSSI